MVIGFIPLVPVEYICENHKRSTMETIAVSKLRENLFTYIKKVQQGQTITITSHGNHIAMLVPVITEIKNSRKTLRELRKTAYVGEVVSPTGEQWEAKI